MDNSIFDGKINLAGDYNIKFPIDILNDYCKKVNSELKGIVNLSVNEYQHPIVSYEKQSLAATLSGIMGPTQVNIQDDLGEQGDYYQKYDVVFQSDVLKNYKFRLMFVGNGIAGYPVKIVLEKGIAQEISKESNNYIIDIENANDFERYIDAIFNSSAVIKVVQDIINAAKRKMIIMEEDNQ